jgi:hypothetical protein
VVKIVVMLSRQKYNYDKRRTIRKVMGEGVGKKPKKNSSKGKWQEKKFAQRETQRKAIHAEEGSHFSVKPV